MNIFMYRCTYCSFCGHCYVTYWDIVGKYSYLVNASICKLSFCNSFVMSESHICTRNIYHVTYKFCNQYSDVVISSHSCQQMDWHCTLHHMTIFYAILENCVMIMRVMLCTFYMCMWHVQVLDVLLCADYWQIFSFSSHMI